MRELKLTDGTVFVIKPLSFGAYGRLDTEFGGDILKELARAGEEEDVATLVRLVLAVLKEVGVDLPGDYPDLITFDDSFILGEFLRGLFTPREANPES